MLQEVCFQLLSNLNIFVYFLGFYLHWGLLCQEVSHFNLALILIFCLLLLLDLLFQVVYHNNPCHFALFGLWSVAGVADILFLFNLLSTFSARKYIWIEEGKRVEILWLRLWGIYRHSFFLISSSTLWQNPVRYHVGLIVMELYHAWRDGLLLLFLPPCCNVGSLQRDGPLVR